MCCCRCRPINESQTDIGQRLTLTIPATVTHMPTTGLTLGKFAPLHLGHQYLIETALAEVDELIILIYHTDLYPVPLNVRAGWLRQRYPQAVVIECWDGPQTVSADPGNQLQQEEYILRQLGGRRITHFYSSEFYGEHVSRRLGALDRRVDEARSTMPVSATGIRANPWAMRQWLSPQVYWDTLVKCVLLGSVSTGKSTLTEALAARYQTVAVPEYGRVYWEQHQQQRRLALEEMDTIARTHQQWEYRMAHEARDCVFVDTNALTTRLFCLDYHGRSTPLLERLADANAARYDLFFVCDDDIPYDDTWDRSGPQKRSVLQRQILADLARRKIPYHRLSGSVVERMDQVAAVLDSRLPPHRRAK